MEEEKRNDDFQIPATQAASEKVASTVATFLPEDLYRLKVVRVATTHREPEKVTNGDAQSWWEPF